MGYSVAERGPDQRHNCTGRFRAGRSSCRYHELSRRFPPSAYLVILSNDPDENPMVVEVSLSINGDLTGVSFDQSLPTHFDLVQNTPNPFNPSTSIAFDVPRRRDEHHAADLRYTWSYESPTLARGYEPAGRKTITWDRESAGWTQDATPVSTTTCSKRPGVSEDVEDDIGAIGVVFQEVAVRWPI